MSNLWKKGAAQKRESIRLLFIRYESFRQYIRLYPVNTALMAVCIAVFLVMVATGGTGAYRLIDFGALTNVEGLNQVWRFITALFVHGGWSHLLFNMFALFVFAPPLERIFGHVRYAVFYIVSGMLGNLAAVLTADREFWIGVGASSAIYGVYGAYLYMTVFQRHLLDQASRTTVYAILVMGLIHSFIVPNIGYWAHIGGLAAGFVLYRIMGGSIAR